MTIVFGQSLESPFKSDVSFLFVLQDIFLVAGFLKNKVIINFSKLQLYVSWGKSGAKSPFGVILHCKQKSSQYLVINHHFHRTLHLIRRRQGRIQGGRIGWLATPILAVFFVVVVFFLSQLHFFWLVSKLNVQII